MASMSQDLPMDEGGEEDPSEVEPDEPVPFSQFGLKGTKDRHLRYVLRRLGCQQPDVHNYDRLELVCVWLADQHRRWESLLPDVKSRLVSDLLEEMYQDEGDFDILFEILFVPTDCLYFDVGSDYSATVEDILRRGLDHSFSKDGQLHTVLDYPFQELYWSDGDNLHLTPCPLGCNSDWECLCPQWCSCKKLCLCCRRPLYLAFYFGLPKLVRQLLNWGARLPLEDACSCGSRVAQHPLDAVFHRVRENADKDRGQLDLLSLQLLLVDTPATFRRSVRSKFWYLNDVIDEIPSLQHMARASIRQQLRASKSIGRPGAILGCGLPRLLQSYVYVDEVIDV